MRCCRAAPHPAPLDEGSGLLELVDHDDQARGAVLPGGHRGFGSGDLAQLGHTPRGIGRHIGTVRRAVSASSPAAAATARAGEAVGVVDSGPLIAGYERVPGELKGIGRSTGPRFATASLKSITRVLTDTGQRSVSEQRAEIRLPAPKFAEYTGWIAQEAGNTAEALRWTHLAVRWGAYGGDETVAAYALVRKTPIAQHRGDTAAAIGFADRAARHPAANPAIRAQSRTTRGSGPCAPW